MPDPPPSRVLVLRIERGTEPIAGTLAEEGGEPHRFRGWLGLARAMERVLGDGPPAPAEDPPWGSGPESEGEPTHERGPRGRQDRSAHRQEDSSTGGPIE